MIEKKTSPTIGDAVSDDLCRSSYLGGTPIAFHYCNKPKGHTGPHSNEDGSWPPGVTNEPEWHRLIETLPRGATGLEE